jgi:hypothetical protein
MPKVPKYLEDVAQLVERNLATIEVAGPSPSRPLEQRIPVSADSFNLMGYPSDCH